MRSSLVIAAYIAVAGAIVSAAPASGVCAADRNIVFVVADDHGLDAGCYGNPVIKTPNLDRLATEGTRFTHAFTTTASCSPSRSVILTGRFGHSNGMYGLQHATHHFQSFQKTQGLPVLLSGAGYRTAIVGKLHVAPEEAYRFETTIPANARNAVQMAERSRAFIAASDPRPFFLYFCPTDPHRSGDRAEEIPGKPDRFGNPPEGKEQAGVSPVVYLPKDVIVPSFLPDTPECRAELSQYYQSVSRVDQGLGKLLAILEEAGVRDSTLVIYISDNGVPFPGAKTTVYEPGIRLPCVVRSPMQKRRGVVCGAMVTWADLAPTILDFAGVLKEPGRFEGRSFLGILEEENPAGWDEVFASHTFHEVTMYYPMRVLRTRRHKLIWNIAHPLSFPFASDLWGSATWQGVVSRGDEKYGRRSVKAYLQRPKLELYDLERDPDETTNLAEDPAHAKVRDELLEKLRTFQKRTGDPWIVKWSHE